MRISDERLAELERLDLSPLSRDLIADLRDARAVLRFYADHNYGPLLSGEGYIGQDRGKKARAYFADKGKADGV